MAEQRNAPVNATGANCFKEAVCIDAGRIFDSCTDAAAIIGLNRGLTRFGPFLMRAEVRGMNIGREMNLFLCKTTDTRRCKKLLVDT